MPRFGLYAGTGDTGGDNVTATMGIDYGYTAAGTFNQPASAQRFYQPTEIGETIDSLGVTLRNASGFISNAQIAVYEYTPTGDITIFGTLQAKVASVIVTPLPADSTWYEYEVNLTTPFVMDVTKSYILAIQGDEDNALTIINGPERAQTDASERDYGTALYGGLLDPWNGGLPASKTAQDYAIWANYTVPESGAPTLTTPYPIGTNNGPLFSVAFSGTTSQIEAVNYLDGNAGWASLLKTNDVVMINCSNATKMYNVTVDKIQRTITLSTGLTIA